MPSRREQIEAMLEEDPQDEFLRYSLAVELDKEGAFDAALTLLRELTTGAPPYIGAFFLAGRRLAERDRLDEARAMLRDGVEQARTQGDAHAAGEMSEFLAALGAG